MKYIADLHLHSKYSRAVSQDMNLPIMAAWAKKKGIDILTTADWTHPLWFREIRGQLEEKSEGLFQLKTNNQQQTTGDKSPLFLLTVEVASIYSQGGKLRRIHNLIFVPSFETAEKISKELQRRGVNLLSDGRPMMGVSSRDLLELVLTIDKKALLIPCHIWTPWFSLYGSMSGFDSIEECFGDLSKYIYGVETGLSSDPEMNWRIKELENRAILSFSDAHSPAKMGREATVFELKEASYENIREAITQLSVFGSRLSDSSQSVSRLTGQPKTGKPETENRQQKTDNRIVFTIEFYPEEGKYHYTGHRNCKVVQSPEETTKNGTKCPVCGRTLTVGVMHRVQQLAAENPKSPPKARLARLAKQAKGGEIRNPKLDRYGVRWIEDPSGKHQPFVKLVPLLEIIAEALSSTVTSLKVKETYEQLAEQFGGEISVFLKTDISEIEKVSGPRIAQGIKKVRMGDIVIEPGYDGEYGKVKIWSSDAKAMEGEGEPLAKSEQMGLF